MYTKTVAYRKHTRKLKQKLEFKTKNKAKELSCWDLEAYFSVSS